jgi:hypothetical protein
VSAPLENLPPGGIRPDGFEVELFPGSISTARSLSK